MTASVLALRGLVAWRLALLLLMEAVRTVQVMTGKVPANQFVPDNANLSPFMQRVARAHLNCIEGLPVFGGLLAIAIMTQARRSPTRWRCGCSAHASSSR